MASFDHGASIPHSRLEALSSWNAGFAHSEPTAPTLQLQIEEHYQHHYPSPANLMGLPHHFDKGQFSGQTLRAELHEIQRPKYGRKFGTVDRRALDDPPVVLLRLFHVYNAGTNQQWEKEVQNYDDISLAGLICMADLFEFPRSIRPNLNLQHPLSTNCNHNLYSIAMAPDRQYPIRGAESRLPPDTLVLMNGYPVTESSKRTASLFGTKFVEPHRIGWTGNNQNQILFTFSDLAVRLEGYFMLRLEAAKSFRVNLTPSRYRFFDIFAESNAASSPILAECYGDPFKIYSSKETPALKESTMLTKLLANHGIPVNVREKARSPRKYKP
ncbi:Velvet domain-containing protein [Mycena venus]|uniref:Velvet domain-containing protein n=1 Tax=Mycena venus TaxID=2733690 RepID=A0A8H7D2M0_9AGAR|nr:Velvet domain-containing protein [Mycena venus]